MIVRNDSDKDIILNEFVESYLVDPQTGDLAGVYTGGFPANLVTQPLPAHSSSERLPTFAGVTSCTPSRGTAVQPGRYEVVAIPSVAGDISAPAGAVTIKAP